MRSENRVVMFTDIKGYTAATSRQTREESARMLALHDALVHPVIRAFAGRRVKTIGDAYLVVFGAPTRALLCAMAIQDRLWDHARRVPEAKRIEIRVALSLGEVRIAKGDVFGDAVNLAARVEAEAQPREIWFTEALYWSLDRSLVPFEEVGYRALKGFPDAVRLFRVPRVGATDAPPYGNAALDLVSGIPEPDPAVLEKDLDVGPIEAGSRGAPILRVGALALLLGGGAGAGWWFHLPPTERALRRGRYEEARVALEQVTEEKGPHDPGVLFLRGRYEQVRADAGAGGSLRAAFTSWSRALAAGSEDALSTLAHEARSHDCERRRLAARALAESRSPEALEPLGELSEAEPPEPPPENALEALRGAFSGPRGCGAGEIARDGIASIERRR
ncbi:adenylate/guanylate cyclase domain-containing protein [Anaeromyxobacter oryzisoli]|uniref:adenylate/guanylate cyclase domain-containing protein n=1 Tax=Anaeromyxobacter oryzisoli TaxID=2925408 RepID=UPI002FCD50EE